MKKKTPPISDNTKSPLMLPQEVADFLRISLSTVYTKKCRMEFPQGSTVKIFGRLMFLREKIEQLVADSVEPSFRRFR